MKIYTKTGDEGKTGLIGGTRVWKNNPRIEAYGTIDELNSFTGLLRCEEIPEQEKAVLEIIQHKLFAIGSHLATDRSASDLKAASIIREKDILMLEDEMDRMDQHLPELTNFVLPGGSRANALCHVCRTVTRRAERRILDLREADAAPDALILKFVNRLSDYFFTLSRYLSDKQGVGEFFWKKDI